MAGMGTGIGEAFEGLLKLAGCAVIFGLVGFGVAVWAIFFRG